MNPSKRLLIAFLFLFVTSLSAQIRLEIEANNTDADLIRLTNNDYARVAAYTASSDRFQIPTFIGFRSRGSILSPLNVNPLDRITGLYGGIYVGNRYRVSSAVEMYVGDVINNSSSPSYIIFGTTNEYSTSRTEKMRIDSEGNVGIGTTTPSEKLEISNGNVYVNGNSNGFILTSPNGQCWHVTIDNSGSFNSSPITCP